MTQEHFDVVIVGSGLSGVDAAYHLQTFCPGKSYVILENRDAIGGTWDLFRYPGIRSDSDMFTFGYSFRPWQSDSAIADGDSIRTYIRETAAEYGIDRKIRFRHRVKSASWSSADAQWTVEVERASEPAPLRLTCNFLFSCTGYYDYAAGYTPEFPGVEKFRGRLVHPQHWPEDLNYAGKRVVVIGSGATAVTIIPAMAKTAALVTMLQRSPTYIVSRPSQDAIAGWLRRHLPVRTAYGLARWYNVLFGLYFYNLSRRKPEAVKNWIVGQARQQLGADYDVATHFTPRYNPWDQRLCLAPDADFFHAIKSGKADVVTDQIETFTADGIRLQIGPRTARRHYRHCDRSQDATPRRHLGPCRRQAGQIFRHHEFQRCHVQRRAEPRRRVRLHQRVVDAEVRSHLCLCQPSHQLYGPTRLCELHAAARSRG